MNKSLVRGALAGVAAIALVGGGSTFAAWSDWNTLEGSSLKAETMTLELDPSAALALNEKAMAPGAKADHMITVVNRSGANTKARLSVTLTDLVGSEDGCAGRSEVVDEAAHHTSGEVGALAADPSCKKPRQSEGEFARDALITIASGPVDANGACVAPRTERVSKLSLASIEDKKIDLLAATDTLDANEKACVAVLVQLPSSVDNSSQGDGATFDLRFDLDQVV